jgi:hypothetical protein
MNCDDLHSKPDRVTGKLEYGKLAIVYTCNPDGDDMDIDDVTLKGFSGKGLGAALCEALQEFTHTVAGQSLCEFVRACRNETNENEY